MFLHRIISLKLHVEARFTGHTRDSSYLDVRTRITPPSWGQVSVVFRPDRCKFLTNLQAVPFKSVHLHRHNEALQYSMFLSWRIQPYGQHVQWFRLALSVRPNLLRASPYYFLRTKTDSVAHRCVLRGIGLPVYIVQKKKLEGKVHPRTGHEGPERE